jgi:hypothetical protein
VDWMEQIVSQKSKHVHSSAYAKWELTWVLFRLNIIEEHISLLAFLSPRSENV